MGYPDLMNPQCKETAVGGSDADAGSKVASPADPGAIGIAVVAEFLVIEGQFHEAGKGEWALLFNHRNQHLLK